MFFTGVRCHVKEASVDTEDLLTFSAEDVPAAAKRKLMWEMRGKVGILALPMLINTLFLSRPKLSCAYCGDAAPTSAVATPLL